MYSEFTTILYFVWFRNGSLMSCSIFKSSGLGAPVRPRSILVQSSVGARRVWGPPRFLRWVSGCENVVLSASWPIRIHQSSCTCFCWIFSLNVLYFYGIWSHQVSRSKKRRVPFRKVWLRGRLRSKPMLQGASHLPTPESNESEVAKSLQWVFQSHRHLRATHFGARSQTSSPWL